MRAILFGATGMVGEGVLHEALRIPNIDSVLVVGRRPCEIAHVKLKEILHNDFFDYSSIEDQMRGYDACLFCLGITSAGKSEQEYRRFTYDLTMAAATTLSRLTQGMIFCYVSGLGTDSSEKGRSMWARVKWKTENDLMKLPFKAVYAFRPGFIKPMRGCQITLAFAKVLAPLYPILKLLFPKYVCTLEDVGRAMLWVAEFGYEQAVLECLDTQRVARFE